MKKYLSLTTLFAFPLVSFAALDGVRGLIADVGGLVSDLIILAAGIALLVFFWGLAKFIYKADDPAANKEGRNLMIWGIIALFVMISVWGLVEFLQEELDIPSNTEIQTLPTPPTFNV